MQENQINQSSQPLVLAQTKRTNLLSTTGTQNPKQNRFIAYFLNISFISLTVRVFRVIYSIVSFLLTVMNSKTIAQKKIKLPNPQPQIVPVRGSQLIETFAPSKAHDEELKEHFLNMASHELKTPMTTITGQAQYALRRLAKMPELPTELATMRLALESIDGQARRLNTLVDDILDLYNIRAGKIPLRLVPCDLVTLCREIVEEQHRLTGRTIDLETPVEAVQMKADTDRLYQVVVNLVHNALRYSPEDSSVKIVVNRQRDIGIIEVQDNGPGIPMEQQTHIFEPFYRGLEEQLSSKSGLGLGLAICKDIVERHQGRIWCRSRIGKGSTFIVELPINKRTTTVKL